jgi:hypothetical protein
MAKPLRLRQIGLALAQFRLCPLAFSDIVVGFHDRKRLLPLISLQGPTARHFHLGSIRLGVHKLAFPAAGAQQLRVDLINRRRENRLQEVVGDLAERLFLFPSIQFLGATIPVSDYIVHVAHKD